MIIENLETEIFDNPYINFNFFSKKFNRSTTAISANMTVLKDLPDNGALVTFAINYKFLKILIV